MVSTSFANRRKTANSFDPVLRGCDQSAAIGNNLTLHGITGEMFAAARDPLFSHRLVERAGISNDLDSSTVATAAQGIFGIVIK
jgi:hypothetical protein